MAADIKKALSPSGEKNEEFKYSFDRQNPGRNSQTYGIARELGTDLELIHEPSVGVVGNKDFSMLYWCFSKG